MERASVQAFVVALDRTSLRGCAGCVAGSKSALALEGVRGLSEEGGNMFGERLSSPANTGMESEMVCGILIPGACRNKSDSDM